MGVRITTFLADEELYVPLARWVPHHLPEALWTFAPWQRGLQRLDVFALSVPFGLARSPDAFLAGHTVQAFLFASAAVPVWLMGRQLGLGAGGSLAAGALCLLGPFGVLATTFLAEPIAYPAYLWALWAAWRALATPSPGGDAGAVCLALAAGLARTQLVGMLLVLPLAALLLGRGRPGARQTLRAHRLAFIVVVPTVLVLLAFRDSVFGTYSRSPVATPARVVHLLASTSVHFAAAVAFAPALLAFVFVGRAALGNLRPHERAFAAVVVVSAAAVGASVLVGGQDERYAVYLAGPTLLCAGLALRGRRLQPGLLVAGALVVGTAAALTTWTRDRGPGVSAIYPAELLVRTTLVGTLGTIGTAVATGALTLAGLAVAGRSRGRPWAVGALLMLQLAASAAVTHRLLADRSGGPSLQRLGWVDRLLPRHAQAAALVSGRRSGLGDAWRVLHYWNGSVTERVGATARAVRLPVGVASLPVDVTGVLARRPPRSGYLLVGRDASPVLRRGRLLGSSPDGRLVLLARGDAAGGPPSKRP
ncbi:MAG: hypothetical protein M3Z33_13280 [Actinomycetota bacterium]|nr:hypothetical protein [Actinomycetota bacterium]